MNYERSKKHNAKSEFGKTLRYKFTPVNNVEKKVSKKKPVWAMT